MPYASKVKIPRELEQLQKPWRINSQDPKVQQWVRFGAQHATIGGADKIIQYISGAAGTIFADTVNEDMMGIFRSFKNVIKEEYFSHHKQKNDDKLFKRFENYLLTQKIKLSCGYRGKSISDLSIDETFIEHTIMILSMLPQHHLGHMHFNELKLYGWGAGTFACVSEYEDPIVYIFDIIMAGPKRNYHAILLHEIGHSFYTLLSSAAKEELTGLFSVIGDNKLGVDYLLGEKDRIYQQQFFEEFTAENYMHYVTQGDRFSAFIEACEKPIRNAWLKIISIYKEYFGGIEYF